MEEEERAEQAACRLDEQQLYEELSVKYGNREFEEEECLDEAYYLAQGRPMMAYHL